MTQSEIQSIIDLEDLPVVINNVVQVVQDNICINNLIPLKIMKVNKSCESRVKQ
jgi:hypothetical protein